MKALSDPNRVTILKILARRHLCVCELTALLGLAQSTVSKHLRILEETGLVSYEKDGSWINYYLADGSDSLYAATLLGHLKTWLEEDPRIGKILTGLAQVDRRRLCPGPPLPREPKG